MRNVKIFLFVVMIIITVFAGCKKHEDEDAIIYYYNDDLTQDIKNRLNREIREQMASEGFPSFEDAYESRGDVYVEVETGKVYNDLMEARNKFTEKENQMTREEKLNVARRRGEILQEKYEHYLVESGFTLGRFLRNGGEVVNEGAGQFQMKLLGDYRLHLHKLNNGGYLTDKVEANYEAAEEVNERLRNISDGEPSVQYKAHEMIPEEFYSKAKILFSKK